MRRAGPGFIMNPVRLFAVYIYMNRRVLPAIYRMAFWNPVFSAIALSLLLRHHYPYGQPV